MKNIRNTLKELIIDKLYYCYPGGNDTYICVGDKEYRDYYAETNSMILSQYPSFEQGGFIEKTVTQNVIANFQMAGGEFCGNGIRSFLALLTKDYLTDRQLLESHHLLTH